MTQGIEPSNYRGAAPWVALALAIGAAFAPPALARPAAAMTAAEDGSDESEALPYLQCVPYARQVSGLQLYGDALTWWDEAAGRYARGREPRVGAVMSFRPFHAMQLGHVAMVSKVIDARTVLLRHANWSPIDGRRGQIEDDVRAVDVSPDNDWSEVRVWYAPLGDLGTTHWPVNGFIYNRKPSRDERAPTPLLPPRLTQLAANDLALTRTGGTSRIDADFLSGIRAEPGTALPTRRAMTPERRWQMARQALASTSVRPTVTRLSAADVAIAPRALRNDPIGRIIAARTARTEPAD